MGSNFTAAGVAWGGILGLLASNDLMGAVAIAGAAGFGMLGLLASFGLIAKHAEQNGPCMKWLLIVPIDLLLIGWAVGSIYVSWMILR